MTSSTVSSGPKWVSVRAIILGRTIAAIRAKIDGEVVWMPRSALEDNGLDADDALLNRGFMPVVELTVAAWKARENGWE